MDQCFYLYDGFNPIPSIYTEALMTHERPNEGWYCSSCDRFYGEEGSTEITCETCGGTLEYDETSFLIHHNED